MSSDREQPEQQSSIPPTNGDPPRSRPLPAGNTFYTPGAGRLRRKIERRSAVPLVWLHNAPRWLLPVTKALAYIGGLLLSGVVGAALLSLLAALFGWLAFLSWPNLRKRERAVRMVVVALLFGLGLLQLGAF